jgi:hypothetical protein
MPSLNIRPFLSTLLIPPPGFVAALFFPPFRVHKLFRIFLKIFFVVLEILKQKKFVPLKLETPSVLALPRMSQNFFTKNIGGISARHFAAVRTGNLSLHV